MNAVDEFYSSALFLLSGFFNAVCLSRPQEELQLLSAENGSAVSGLEVVILGVRSEPLRF